MVGQSPTLLEPLGQLVGSDVLPQAFFAAASAGLQLPVLVVETMAKTGIRVGVAFGKQDFIQEAAIRQSG